MSSVPVGLEPFLRCTSDPAFVVNAEGSILAWNQPLEQLTGFLTDFALGKPLQSLFPALPLQARLAEVLQYGELQLAGLQFSPLPAAPAYLLHLFPLPQPEGPSIAGLLKPAPAQQPAQTAPAAGTAAPFPDLQIADAAPAIITLFDLAEGRHIYFNRELERQTGYTQAEVNALGSELVHPEDLPRLMAHLAQVAEAADGEVLELEYRLKSTSGAWRWYLVRSSVFSRTEAGRAAIALAVFLDRDEKQHTGHLLRTSQVGIMALEAVYDQQAQLHDFHFAFLNDTAATMLQLDPELAVGTSLQAALAQTGAAASLAHYRQAWQTREAVAFEEQFRHSGRPVWLSVTAAPTGAGLTVTFTDISRQKEAEQQHLESQQFIRTVTDATPVLLLVYDLKTQQPVFTNQGFTEVLGLTLADLSALEPGAFQQLVLHPDDVQPLQAHLARVAASREGEVHDFRVRMRMADGRYRWFMVRDSIFRRDPNGSQLLGLTVMQDIDELKQSKRLLESVVNSSMNLIMAFDAVRTADGQITDFRCTLANETVERLAGRPGGSMTGLLLSELQQDPDGGARMERYREVVETGMPARFEQAYAPGNMCYLVTAVKQGDGIVATFADITDLKKAEEKLAHSEAFIRKITEAAPLIITLFDIEQNTFLFQSAQLAQVLGYTYEEAAALGNEQATRLVHPEDLAKSPAHYQRLASLPDGEALEIEFRARQKSGEYRWLVARDIVFSRKPDGSPSTILGVTQDIHEIKRSKDLLAGVLESSLSGISAFRALRNEAGEIIDFGWLLRNEAAERMLGPAPENQTMLQRWPGSRQNGNFSSLVGVVETGQPLHYESFITQDDVSSWFEVTAVKMGDGVAVTYSDITQRKVAEEKVRKNEALLTEAQQIAHLGIWEWDVVEDKVYWSDSLYEMFSIKQGTQQIDLNTYLDLLEPEDRQRISGLLEQTLLTHEPFTFPHVVKHPDGSLRHLIGKGRLLTDLHGRPVRLIGTAMDVTELIQIREQLNAMEQVRLLGEAIPQVVWTARPDGKTNYVNQRWYDYTGLSEAQMMSGEWPQLVIHPEEAAKAGSGWAEALSSRKAFELEVRMRRHDGTYRWFLTRAVPLLNADGQVEKWFGTSTDIDDHKRTLEEMVRIQQTLSGYNLELTQKNEELRQINSDLDNFIYTASHDLKAPINNIEGLLDLLQREAQPGSEVAGQVFEHMQQSISRFKQTLADLSNITKAERTQAEEATTIYLPELLEEVEADVAGLARESRARISFRLDVPEIVFSRKNIRSILYNLLSNALKYRAPDREPAILISTQALPDGMVLLTVADNGLGLDPKHRHRIFEMFRRVHTHVEGSGVGLYIVKRMVENAGGRIEVESTPGKGAAFKVYLRQ